MRINRETQAGIMLALYLCRSGRTSLSTAAANLGLSRMFLAQVASKLRRQGLLQAVTGTAGGYTLVGDPTIGRIMQVLGAMKLVSYEEYASYGEAGAEGRAMQCFVVEFRHALLAHLNTTVGQLSKNLAQAEVGRLDALSPDNGVN